MEANCARGNDQYVQLQALESAFAFFLKTKGWRSSSHIAVAHEWVSPMCDARGFQKSPGYVLDARKIDTRHVVGVSVVRFQEA